MVVVVAIRNEAAMIRRRLDNLLEQQYPESRLRIAVVCNGTTDGGGDVAASVAQETSRVSVIWSAANAGKSGALNAGIAAARGADIVVFADARQVFAPDAIMQLVTPFADPSVGAVTGRLTVSRAGASAVDGVGVYWSLESRLRAWESRSGSVVGATGAIYAVRRELVPVLPANLILDDVYIPLLVAMQRRRIVMAEQAIAVDVAAKDAAAEFSRKRRTMVGNIQLLTTIDGLLSPRRNPLLWRFLSHKLLRLLTPFCLVTMLVLAAAIGGHLYLTLFAAQFGVYLLGAIGLTIRAPLLSLPSAFVLIHAAIFAAAYRWKQDASAVWTSPARHPSTTEALASSTTGREVSTNV